MVEIPDDMPSLQKTHKDLTFMERPLSYISSIILPDEISVPFPWFDHKDRRKTMSSLSTPICSIHNSSGHHLDGVVSAWFELSGDNLLAQTRSYHAKTSLLWTDTASSTVNQTLWYEGPLPGVFSVVLRDSLLRSEELRWAKVMLPPELIHKSILRTVQEIPSLLYKFAIVAVDMLYGSIYVERYDDTPGVQSRCLYHVQY